MAPLLSLLDAEATARVRRSLPPGAPPLLRVASLDALVRALDRRAAEGVLLNAARLDPALLAALRREWPALPVVAVVEARAADAALALRWRAAGAQAVVVADVDEAAAGALLLRHAWVTARARAFATMQRAARCESPLQAAAWARLLATADAPPPLAKLAAELGVARETLSRHFAAGDAPTLKRAADAARVAFAAQLLANPACPVPTAARLLGYAGPAHLRTAARRIAGVAAAELAALGPAGVLTAFLRGRGRPAGDSV